MPEQKTPIAIFLLAVVGACAVPVTERYKSMNQAMGAEVHPLVEQLLTTELNKDADKVDFEAIRSGAMSVRSIFRQALDQERALYREDPEYRASAKTAAGWFRDIATAANLKQHGKLVDLFKQKKAICGSCHD